MRISDIPTTTREASMIVNAFASALSYVALQHPPWRHDVLTMAADHITSPIFAADPECRETIEAFARFLREQAKRS